MGPLLDIPLGNDAVALLDALVAAGHDALLVGGAVRDALLLEDLHDLDVATSATPDQIRSVAEGAGWCRRVYAVGERFGTLGFVLADGSVVEVSQLRGDDFESDAWKRDLTVNSMAMSWPTRELVDPTGGRADLAARLLRAPGDPEARIAEDPLRALRVARFVSELGFGVEPATASAVAESVPLLKDVAAERIRDELTRLITGAHPHAGLDFALETGLLAALLPELSTLEGHSQPSFHRYDVLTHTFVAVSLAPATPRMRWAALLHDTGKGPTRSVDATGRVRFIGHADAGAAIARDVAERLRCSGDDARAVEHLVREHMRLGVLDAGNERAVDRAVRRLDLRRHAGADADLLVCAEDALELELADLGATAHAEDVPAARERLSSAIAAARERGARGPAQAPVSGSRLMRELGIAEGPEVGRALQAIADEIDAGRMRPDDEDAAIRVARRAVRR